ncbi:Os01g0148300 [Oryza sativa Japonica Group]|uniref:Os01g0148300 protein n=1 Tax=Oryza sativa subsp. japonica TaxID=39947 RepID=A0A0P0UY97_ORYSJ|nr:Os01g0148300 [Oryza sativa Japonica Group]
MDPSTRGGPPMKMLAARMNGKMRCMKTPFFADAASGGDAGSGTTTGIATGADGSRSKDGGEATASVSLKSIHPPSPGATTPPVSSKKTPAAAAAPTIPTATPTTPPTTSFPQSRLASLPHR